MTRLTELYHSVGTFKGEGIELGDLLDRISEVEQDIIKKEILPKIEPIIGQIERELVLVVDYVPNEPLSVRISCRRNFTEQMKTIEIISG